MLKNILFYAIILFVAASMQSCYCMHINEQRENKQEKYKNDSVYNEEIKRQRYIEWVMDDTWE